MNRFLEHEPRQFFCDCKVCKLRSGDPRMISDGQRTVHKNAAGRGVVQGNALLRHFPTKNTQERWLPPHPATWPSPPWLPAQHARHPASGSGWRRCGRGGSRRRPPVAGIMQFQPLRPDRTYFRCRGCCNCYYWAHVCCIALLVQRRKGGKVRKSREACFRRCSVVLSRHES